MGKQGDLIWFRLLGNGPSALGPQGDLEDGWVRCAAASLQALGFLEVAEQFVLLFAV